MKVKTAELQGAALDWAVANAAFPRSVQSGDRLRVRGIVDGELCCIGSVWLGKPGSFTRTFEPSTDWSQGGPLMQKYRVSISTEGDPLYKHNTIASIVRDGGALFQATGKNHLMAAMRAIVAAKIGYKVEIPDELAQ